MKKSGVFFIVLLILFGCNLVSPKRSLKEKTDEVIQLQNLARKSQNNDSILYYVQQSQKLLDYNSEICDTLHLENKFLKGYYFKRKNNLDSARYYFHEVINSVQVPNNRSKNRVYFRNAWEMEERKNNIANAMSIAEKFIEITDEHEFKYDLVYAYNYLERKNSQFKDYTKSLYYNSKALKAAEESGNMSMYMLTSISKVWTYYKSGKKQQTFHLLDSLKNVKSSINAKRQLFRTIAFVHYYEGDLKSAINNYKEVIHLTKEQEKEKETYESKADFNYNLLEAYNNITESYLEIGEYNIAQKYLDSTKAIITDKSHPPYVKTFQKHDFLLSYRTQKSEKEVLKEYRDLIENTKKTQHTKINEKLYALKLANEKEKIVIKEKNELEIRNIKLLALSGISVLLLVIGILFYRQRNYKFEKQEIQMQQRLLRSQMNSHFSFNTLSVIQDKIKDDQELAANYLTKFSRLLRLLLSNSLSNYVVIEDELDLLRKYLDLQLYRFPNAFEYEIELINIEEDDILFIPPMLIQPFIENSIEHGFKGINYEGKVLIKLELLNEKYISCLIDDNGIGLKQTKKEYKNSISTSLISKFTQKITKRKISILDKKELKPKEKGVRVEFLIPYKFTNND
ncbi:sensor histidine kinase [Tenacibaculum sp. 190524A05c]|uniref:Two-component system sensor histidine kinase n=1 Tax=Tenacibaculum platacis TaxID=3137852 RepID=A0ABM9NY63_9FLAO